MQAPSGDIRFSTIAAQSRGCDAGGKRTTSEGDTQFGGQRAPHTKRARSCEIVLEGYSRTIAEQRIEIYGV